jgi:NADH-quinone oxidoreductase subunit F
MSRYFGRFNRYQSCGKCVPCRVGTKNLLHMVDRIALGGGKPEDIPIMEKWSDHVVEMSLCGLGQTAPLPLLGGLRYFRDEFDEHINQKHCRAGVCEVLVQREAMAQGRQVTGQVQPGWVEERFLPARIGERYHRQFGAITQNGGNGSGAGSAPAATQGKSVGR